MKARQHSGRELCCCLSLEARRYETSIEALASPVIIRSQNDEIERVSFFSPPLDISLGRRVVFTQNFRRRWWFGIEMAKE
jgi:hypothetical protein